MVTKADEKRKENQRHVFEFLVTHFKSQKPFTKGDLKSATTWHGASFPTYWSKQFKQFVVPAGGGSYRVSEAFRPFARWESFTRRNWWDILAGGKLGKPSTVGGRLFPVLKAAQIRQGMPITPNAVSRADEDSPPPAQRVTKRWPKRRKNLRPVKSRVRVSEPLRAQPVTGALPRSA
ncbi:MAG: hypothetical protein ACREQR_09110 [Candidatus Binataceae bacterium]